MSENSAQAGNVGMTDDTFATLLDDYAITYYCQRECVPPSSAEDVKDTRQAVIDHVNTLNAEIARLQARQITPEMEAVWIEYQMRKANNTLSGEIRPLQTDLWGAFKAMMEGGKK